MVTLHAAPVHASIAQPAAHLRQADEAREITLKLPHTLNHGETAYVLIEVGVIGRSLILITTADGHSLGSISPFAVRSGQVAGTYTLPIPPEAFHGRTLTLRLSLMQSGDARRAPTSDEVKSIRLLVRPIGKGG
jgi:hypothetical protein